VAAVAKPHPPAARSRLSKTAADVSGSSARNGFHRLGSHGRIVLHSVSTTAASPLSHHIAKSRQRVAEIMQVRPGGLEPPTNSFRRPTPWALTSVHKRIFTELPGGVTGQRRPSSAPVDTTGETVGSTPDSCFTPFTAERRRACWTGRLPSMFPEVVLIRLGQNTWQEHRRCPEELG
jgi:hypothetical protein